MDPAEEVTEDNGRGSTDEPKSEVQPDVAGQSGFKRKLVALQVRASVLGRQLKLVAGGSKSLVDVYGGFDDEWRDCFESVSLIHADILASNSVGFQEELGQVGMPP